ncbi:MAG TPA: ABC transporter permease [Pirellulaceae bacterium]|nr:ABC transporter permease [Planctomycetales bacterium]MCB9936943.1 ABC transporter permease [Planctomycetaceae bacterium]HRX79552.1 ABC transporter permease [Pirellulaceae bacterium]
MTFDQVIPDFGEWLFGGFIISLIRVSLLIAGGVLVGFLVASARRGPVEGFYSVAKVIASSVVDFVNWSVPRTIAMAMLAVQEAIRRRVLIAFVVFVVIILFAGWYLDVESDNPARLYLSFVLTASNYLVVLLALFLSTFSLPTDIKNRTIYTVVTKPVRSWEIVLGRIIGFVTVGTMLLVPMGIVSYFFVQRGLSHEHAVEEVAAVSVGDVTHEGETSYDSHHRHTFKMFEDGTGETDVVMSHWHPVTKTDEGYDFGPAIGLLQARVPVFGKLRFKDRAGADTDKGINVGHEWSYRSYIEGGTLAAAIWTFENVTPERYPDGFDLEMNLRVFRTYKGDMEKGILGSIVLRNPNPSAKVRRSEAINFTAKEFVSDKQTIPSSIRVVDNEDGSVRDGNLFDLVDDEGRLEIWIQCGERSQYYGMAERDVYILDRDASFVANLAKGYVGIWLQMVMVTSFGVMFSTFLSGAVAMMATLSSIVIGYFSNFILEIATGSLDGGGPLESLIRIVTQQNVQVDLEIGKVPLAIVEGIDGGFMKCMQAMAGMLPDYGHFTTTQYVAYGYNIDGSLLSMQLLTAFCYVFVVSLISYYLLKTREIAA